MCLSIFSYCIDWLSCLPKQYKTANKSCQILWARCKFCPAKKLNLNMLNKVVVSPWLVPPPLYLKHFEMFWNLFLTLTISSYPAETRNLLYLTSPCGWNTNFYFMKGVIDVSLAAKGMVLICTYFALSWY